ncbi:MAG: phytanoyl-CoA dioxygenase family protein [Alphaproteobacteria bacterium]|uniref:phytanoyl-CoA dioxygenase family protein n=1 Tax=Alphaproteobacteria TaxID=28211 RepID=UPI003266FFD7
MSDSIQFRSLEKDELYQHLRNIRVYGYTLIPQAIPEETVAFLKARVENLWDAVKNLTIPGKPDRDVHDKVVYNLQNKDKCFIDLLNCPYLRAIGIEILNDPHYRFLPPDKPNYVLSYYNARSSGQPLDLHIDSRMPSPGNNTWMMQAVFMLDSMDEQNGCTTIVPGSHRSGQFTDREFKDVKKVTAQAGDLVFWDSRVWHGTLGNVSEGSRWGLIATLASWWVKPSMDMTRSLPDAIYRQLTDEQKALLGFCSIPATDEFNGINTKTGYDALKPSVHDYYPERQAN